MSKARKKTFPKPPQRLNSKTAEKLGDRSNQAGYEASIKAIYNQPDKPKHGAPLSEVQLNMLTNLRKNLSSTYQKNEL